jgi:mxaJ protein
MSSRCLSVVLLLVAACYPAIAAGPPLRICADPDNPPFSAQPRGGFENAGFENVIGAMVAHDLHREPVVVWARSRRGFLREQFNRNACDVLMGVPEGVKAIATTRPYYRSSYVFVTKAREHLRISSFSDPQLAGRRIGLQVLEEDMSPPSIPLICNGRAAQLVGFESFGREGGDIVRAVADGRVGVAVVWGPAAGYFAAKQTTRLELRPVSPAVDLSGIPFTFALAMGVHKRDSALRDQLNASLMRLQPRIDAVLARYHVPVLPLNGGAL